MNEYAQRVIRAFFWADYKQYCLNHTAYVLWGVGLLILLSGYFLSIPPLFALVLLPLPLVSATCVAYKCRMAINDAYIWLDIKAGGQGFVVSYHEFADKHWRERALSYASSVNVEVSRKLQYRHLLLPILFSGLTVVWATNVEHQSHAVQSLLYDEKKRIEKQVDILEDGLVAAHPELQAIEKSIEQLRLSDQNLEHNLEALDTISERLQKQAELLAQSAQQATAAVSKGRHDESSLSALLSKLESQKIVPPELSQQVKQSKEMSQTTKKKLIERLQQSQQSVLQVVHNPQVKQQLARSLQQLYRQQGNAQKDGVREGKGKESQQSLGSQPSTSDVTTQQSGEQISASQGIEEQGEQSDNQSKKPAAGASSRSPDVDSRLAFGEPTAKAMEKLTPVQIPAAEQVDAVHVIEIGTAFGRPQVSPIRAKTTGVANVAQGSAIEGAPLAPQYRKPVHRFFSGD